MKRTSESRAATPRAIPRKTQKRVSSTKRIAFEAAVEKGEGEAEEGRRAARPEETPRRPASEIASSAASSGSSLGSRCSRQAGPGGAAVVFLGEVLGAFVLAGLRRTPCSPPPCSGPASLRRRRRRRRLRRCTTGVEPGGDGEEQRRRDEEADQLRAHFLAAGSGGAEEVDQRHAEGEESEAPAERPERAIVEEWESAEGRNSALPLPLIPLEDEQRDDEQEDPARVSPPPPEPPSGLQARPRPCSTHQLSPLVEAELAAAHSDVVEAGDSDQFLDDAGGHDLAEAHDAYATRA